MSVTISGNGTIVGVVADPQDTGLPWEIPFAGGGPVGSLAAADELQALAIAAGLTAAGPAGIGSNVVQTVKTDTFSTTSATYTDVTGLTVTITPTSDTSKILVIGHVSLGQSSGDAPHLVLMRDSTIILQGNADGAKVQSTLGWFSNSDPSLFASGYAYLDSPGVDTATVYKLQLRRGSAGTAYVNRAHSALNDARISRPTSSIIAIEVDV